MSFSVHTSKESARIERALEAGVSSGMIGKWVPLNGGSDTRKDARDYYMQTAIAARIEYRQIGGFAVTIGGPFESGR